MTDVSIRLSFSVKNIGYLVGCQKSGSKKIFVITNIMPFLNIHRTSVYAAFLV